MNKKIKLLNIPSKIKLLKKILKKSYKRGYKKSYNILKYIIPNIKLKNIILPKNIININELLEIEQKHLDILNNFIKDEIKKLNLKIKVKENDKYNEPKRK